MNPRASGAVVRNHRPQQERAEDRVDADRLGGQRGEQQDEDHGDGPPRLRSGPSHCDGDGAKGSGRSIGSWTR